MSESNDNALKQRVVTLGWAQNPVCDKMCVKQTSFTHFHSMNIVRRYRGASHNASYLISIWCALLVIYSFSLCTLSQIYHIYMILHDSTWLLSFVEKLVIIVKNKIGGRLLVGVEVVEKKGKRKKIGKGLWYKYNNYYFGEWAQSVPYHTWPLRMMDKNSWCIGSPPLPDTPLPWIYEYYFWHNKFRIIFLVFIFLKYLLNINVYRKMTKIKWKVYHHGICISTWYQIWCTFLITLLSKCPLILFGFRIVYIYLSIYLSM